MDSEFTPVTVGNLSYPKEWPPPGELVFDANFESGNLGRVDCIGKNEYDLFIRPDTCNAKYRVWFHFAVDNAIDKQRVVFNIVNFSKLRSLFDEGVAAPVVRTASQSTWNWTPQDRIVQTVIDKPVYILRSRSQHQETDKKLESLESMPLHVP